jgi:hypothetical protein
LVEYRGDPFTDPFDAVGSLVADKERVNRRLPVGSEVSFVNHMTIPRPIKLAARRLHTKGLIKFQNLYGKAPSSLDHAGIHISFTSERTIDWNDNCHRRSTTVNQLWDFARVFRELDKIYASEIKAARRVPGFYEIKDDLRIEYRSLPNNIDLWKLAENLVSLF